MILRDPVHGLVAFEGDAEQVVMTLLATREVQRLRRVRQLGLTSLVFPGAEHSRFAHAIGAAHVMVRRLEHARSRQAETPPEQRVTDASARDAVAAALLHDLGHGPFSHLFEEVVPRSKTHETWTKEVLLDPDSEVHRALEHLSSGMAARVVALLDGSYPIGWLSRAVSGTLDVDRSDYLLRDSHMTGVRYGLYDLDWLLHALSFAEVPGGGWVLAIEGRKGLPPIEGFFLARQFMFQQVYHHKATRAAECLILAMFRRLAELIEDGSAPPSTPRVIRAAVLGEPLSPKAYLELDDPRLMSCFAEWEACEDRLLAGFAADLRHRRLPKTIPLPDREEARPLWERVRDRASEVAQTAGHRPDLSVWLDVATDVPYLELDEPGKEGLWVRVSRQPLLRLGDASFSLRQLRNQSIVRPRLVFVPEIRSEVERAVAELVP